MDENKKDSNIGCIVLIVIFVLGGFVYIVLTTSKEELANGGAIILATGVVFAIGYFLNEYSNRKKSESVTRIYYSLRDDYRATKRRAKDNDDFSLKGCLGLIGGLVLVGLFISVLTSSTELNSAVGVLFFAAISIGMGILIYNIFKS